MVLLLTDASRNPPNTEGIRKLSVKEWARLQGFPETYYFPVSNTQAYKQLANSVPIPVSRILAEKIKKILEK